MFDLKTRWKVINQMSYKDKQTRMRVVKLLLPNNSSRQKAQHTKSCLSFCECLKTNVNRRSLTRISSGIKCHTARQRLKLFKLIQ